jgi:RIO kinase 1
LTSSFIPTADTNTVTDAGADPAGTRFTLDFRTTDDLDTSTQRWTTYWDVERLCRGPEPTPAWVVADRGAVDTELGILKTGKEADVFLLHRAAPGSDGVVMAAKRYRSAEHTTFHRSSSYTEGRRTRNTRDARALAKKSRFGREIASGQWAMAEWEALRGLWLAGVPVPYPVQIDGTELLMELVVDPGAGDGSPAPRLAGTRPDPARLRSYYDQVRGLLGTMAARGIAHGDLSAYNLLAAGDRLVVIDLPQVVDLVANPTGLDFLHRDCRNMVAWFRRRGLDVDAEDLFAEVIAHAF